MLENVSKKAALTADIEQEEPCLVLQTACVLPLTVGWRKSIVRKRYLVIASIIATPKLCDTFCNCGSAKWSGCQEDLIRAETL